MIRVLLYGLGPIGVMVGRQLATRDGFRIVGAVDIDPAKVGRDVGEIAELPRPLRVKVSPDARRAIRAEQTRHRRAVHVVFGSSRHASDAGGARERKCQSSRRPRS